MGAEPEVHAEEEEEDAVFFDAESSHEEEEEEDPYQESIKSRRRSRMLKCWTITMFIATLYFAGVLVMVCVGHSNDTVTTTCFLSDTRVAHVASTYTNRDGREVTIYAQNHCQVVSLDEGYTKDLYLPSLYVLVSGYGDYRVVDYEPIFGEDARAYVTCNAQAVVRYTKWYLWIFDWTLFLDSEYVACLRE